MKREGERERERERDVERGGRNHNQKAVKKRCRPVRVK